MDPLSIIIFIFLITLSAFFSGTEIALMSISQHKIISLIKEKKSWAKFLKKIKSENDKLLIAILIWNNLVNVWASALATTTSIQLAEKFSIPGSYWIWIATWVVTLILLLFWEITPKTICSKYSEQVSLFVAPFYFIFTKILYPLIIIIEVFVKTIWYLFGNKKMNIKMSSEELEAFIDMSHENWAVKSDEHRKIKWVLDLGDTLAESVMTPRVQMDAVNENITIDSLCEYLLMHSHSRIPVYKETIDRIDSFITFKQAFKLKEAWRGGKKLSEIQLDEIIKIPLNQPIDIVFKTLQKSRKHMALVLDEHWWVEWLITIEDIVEEVFGDIKDETDKEEIYITKLKDGKIQANGNVIIDDILEELKINDIWNIWLGEEFSWENLSYIITSKLERFPINWEKINLIWENKTLTLEVKQISNGKIWQVVIEKILN